MTSPSTPSQTVGPFFHLALQKLERNDIAASATSGERITIRGRVLDGDGAGVCDAMLELWQADATGDFPEPAGVREVSESKRSRGFGRVFMDANGGFEFTTLKPGRVSGPHGILQSPHIVVMVFSRGLLKPLLSRIYFPDEPSNEEDHILNLIPRERRGTLVARRRHGAGNVLEWNVILQGDAETVFFDC
ncbi:MAG: protocatechuate 3,4-dioxygenase subunit alpha [Candidatus Acidiferrales bacterium]